MNTNVRKPIFVVVYMFVDVGSVKQELRVVDWKTSDAEPKTSFRYAAQIESDSIQEFLADEIVLRVKIDNKVQPEPNVQVGSDNQGTAIYNDISFHIKNIAVSYTQMYENDRGIFYALTVLSDNIHIPRIGKSRSRVIYSIDAVEESGSDVEHFEENKKDLVQFFRDNEKNLRQDVERKQQLFSK